MNDSLTFALLLSSGLVTILLTGCSEEGIEVRASFETRAARRAYDGAPPVIPHEPLGAACVTCHTSTGQVVPNIGFAPANPHDGSQQAGSFSNCRQCHVFQNTDQSFRDSQFVGLPQQKSPSQRLFPGAPPVIPHTTLLRENCLACHSGTSARQEIVCSHPLRSNCRQCHVEMNVTGSLVFSGGRQNEE